MYSGLTYLVVGYGSIGMRHTRILCELGCDVAVVSRRDIRIDNHSYKCIEDAIREFNPVYVVIANETSLHHGTINRLASIGYEGSVLVEKPLFNKYEPVPSNKFCKLKVAYNLRFHPVIKSLKELLTGQKTLSVHSYVGKYLPDWRPETDYRKSYSACLEKGGGVLLDLSHEFDFLSWMFGDWLKVAALGGHLSPLDLQCEDTFSLLLSYQKCPVATVHLNYVDRRGRRTIVVNTESHTYEADLMKHQISIDMNDKKFVVDRDDTYRLMHTSFIEGNYDNLCSVEEGLSTLKLVDSSRKSAVEHKWIKK